MRSLTKIQEVIKMMHTLINLNFFLTQKSALVKPETETQSAENCQFSIFLALPSDAIDAQPHQQQQQQQQRCSMHNLIYYLDQKTAAGVIPMPSDQDPIGSIYFFTPSSMFATRLLQQTLPHFRLGAEQPPNETAAAESLSQHDFLIVVILKLGNNSIH